MVTMRSNLFWVLAIFATASAVNAHFHGVFDNLKKEAAQQNGKTWVLLVAGSNTYGNYRHQADICHAYQIVHKHGIPDEQIVVMMYDDIANSPMNPTKGIVINHPNGNDVYKGVLKDYIGEDVAPKTFLSVLQGDKEAVKGVGSGKVIDSGPNDNVFVYFADHGAPGLIAFPSDELYSKDLINALTSMHSNKRYAKLAFYLEACESGSMFEGLLPANINIYATTAANAEESSYACYYDSERETYLGDVYSVQWMEDSDQHDLTKETLQEQFETVKKLTTTSHVQVYGDVSMGSLALSEFQGASTPKPEFVPKVELAQVPSWDVPLSVLYHRQRATTNREIYYRLSKEIKKLKENREYLRRVVHSIAKKTLGSSDQAEDVMIKKRPVPLRNSECYATVGKHFSRNCFLLGKHNYATRFMYVFANMCELEIPATQQTSAMTEICADLSIDDAIV